MKELKRNQRIAGFTLIELLVVVAILAIVAALLLPALTQGKTVARRVQCVSHLKQLSLAAQMYWDDHDGRAFRYQGPSTNGGRLYWFGWIERYSGNNEGQRSFDLAQGVLFPYLQGQGVEVCPAFEYLSPSYKLKATTAAYGYGYNLHLGPRSGPAMIINNLVNPSRIVLLADAAQVNDFQPPASFQRPLVEEFYYVNDSEPTTHFRHQEKANVVFTDGHVEAKRPWPGSIDARLPEVRVGRLPPEFLRVNAGIR